MKISVIVPVYGCPTAVEPLCTRLNDTLTKITEDYEVILVNDACPMNSWAEIEKACAANPKVIGIDLSRNFGQHRAITAGLDYASGNWIVVMDCDLQDRPEGILDLYNKAQEGYDVVFAKRKERQDSRFVKFCSKSFYSVYNAITGCQFDGSISNFSISRRDVIVRFCDMREQNRDYGIFLNWLGYRQTAVEVLAESRYAGDSSYNLIRKIKLATHIITAQSNKPLQLSIGFGFFVAFCAAVYAVARIILYIFIGSIPEGWTTLIVVLCFLCGLILISNGILGIYIGYIFNEVRHRPLYVVRSVLNPHSHPADMDIGNKQTEYYHRDRL